MVTTSIADPARDQDNGRIARANLGGLVDAIGTTRFADELLHFLRQASGAEFVHFFEMFDSRPHVLRSVSLDASGEAERQADFYLSRKLFSIDPWVADWMNGPSTAPALFHFTRREARCVAMRNYYDTMQVADRVMVCGTGEQGVSGISIANSVRAGTFDDTGANLELVRDIALPLFMKHRDYCSQRAKFSRELLDIREIEQRMQDAPEKLPPREIQVAARILRGLTAAGIALDLGIGRETVICYRKRLYEKLSLGSYHDLLSWYMRCSAGGDPGSFN